MHKALLIIKDKKGISNFITTLVSIVLILAVVIVVFSAGSIFFKYQDLNNYAAFIVRDVCINGDCNTDRLESVYAELSSSLNISPDIDFETAYYNAETKTVQYGTQIKVTAALDITFEALNVSIPITLKISKVGKSEVYFK